MRIKRILGVLLVVGFLPSVPSHGAPDVAVERGSRDQATATQLEAYASYNRVDLAEAARGIEIAEQIVRAYPELVKIIPTDRLAGIAVLHGVDSVPYVQVRITSGPEIPELTNFIKRMSDFDVSVVGGSSTVEDRVEAIESGSEGWNEELGTLQGAYVDETTDDIVLMLADTGLPIDEGQKMPLSGAEKFLPVDSTHLAPPKGASFVIERTSPGSDGNRGGRDLSSCTLGFTVVISGQRRILTAGHCSPPQSWRDFGSSSWNATTRVGLHHNTFADMAWFKLDTSHVVRPQAYYETTSLIVDNQPNGTNVQGMSACHRGKTTGFSCGGIMSVTYKPTYSGACPGGPCEARFVLAGAAAGEPGDSGGPVWAPGIVPIGIYKGQNSGVGSNHRIWWSKLGNMPSGMGILLP